MAKGGSPALILLVLLILGGAAGVYLHLRLQRIQTQGGTPSPAAMTDALPSGRITAATGAGEEPEDLKKQITLLEGQVEYLQGQVSALQDENAELIQKLGSLGMKRGATMDAVPAEVAPDYVGMGLEMMKLRKLQALPIPTKTAGLAEVEAAILAALKRRQPDDEPARFALALAALGWIDAPVDFLKLRAATLARQLGGWFDEQTQTLLTVEPGAVGTVFDEAQVIAFSQLLREFGPTLFPQGAGHPITTDERLARECLLAGDASLTRFLFGLQHPELNQPQELPPEDPDHPLNQVPLPVYLRELISFSARHGFDFAQSLHSAGEFPQLNAAYSRPPTTTAEVIEPERYLDPERLPVPRIEVSALRVQNTDPYWDDRLGRYAVFAALRAHNADEEAGNAARGWQSDRLLAYAAPEAKRDHAAWQTLWLAPDHANAFFKAMQNSLSQRYQAKPVSETADTAEWKVAERFVSLRKNKGGVGVLLIDAASADFAKALQGVFAGERKQ